MVAGMFKNLITYLLVIFGVATIDDFIKEVTEPIREVTAPIAKNIINPQEEATTPISQNETNVDSVVEEIKQKYNL